jgi:hypothetical protein
LGVVEAFVGQQILGAVGAALEPIATIATLEIV